MSRDTEKGFKKRGNTQDTMREGGAFMFTRKEMERGENERRFGTSWQKNGFCLVLNRVTSSLGLGGGSGCGGVE